MPYSLRQLQSQRDKYIKNIQELRASAEDKGAAEIGELRFHAIDFFNGLTEIPSDRIDIFLSFFPILPEILECARKAANEEQKRRKCEVKIANMKKEKRKKRERESEEEEDEQRNTKKTPEDADRWYWFWGRYITNNELNIIYLSPKQ